MWTQRDQIQAYRFLRRRLVSALVSADANHPVAPAKRVVLGTALGLAVALLVSAVFGIVGLLAPTRAEAWRQGGQVLIEKETGTRFVLGEDGLLHPVLNYASARLLAGGDGTKTLTVPAKSLSGAPRGAAVGIAGAPDSLPQPERLLSGAWTTCTRVAPDRPSGEAPIATVLLGPGASGTEISEGRALLARLPSGERFLVTGGQRYRLDGESAVVALGYAGAQALLVAPAWLNTLPAGRDLSPVEVPDAGALGVQVGSESRLVGQVLVSEVGEYYLVQRNGLAVITETEADLVLGAPGNTAAYPGERPHRIEVATADIGSVPRVPGGEDGYPMKRPDPVAPDRTAAVCTTDGRITVSSDLPLRPDEKVVPVGAPTPETANEIYVPGGAGAIVAEELTPGAVYLITDTGLKYPIPGEEAVSALGYGNLPRRGAPASVLALFPTGTALDPARARQVIAG
ncbi:type VII secretion protein EccB [Saccharopolyspora hirsuta]|uniref:Type VII secretion protein EccB n=1 Tax=Saccharopolyspora hirsuta TaxID=1837 RepID=A0A5M7BTK5_SACHI|nr:type VII secretion protein EccB [Saccharopolyspora hirsuta]KAA5830564.1 type VII secretion protein EccB [Saccharopolyspora hirsuta]